VPVAVNPSTTALLALDFSHSNCSPGPACAASLPAVAAFIDRARQAGVAVVHSSGGSAPMVPEIVALAEEPIVSSGPDKFFRTALDQILKDRGIETTIIVGTAANGAALYTAFGAAQRGYTVVVAEDGISSATDFATFITRWQLLNGPGTTNAENKPLEKGV
jgi:nicotinamidase-related amidase